MSNDIKQIPIDFFQRNQILILSESPLTLGICSTSNMEALEDIRLITKLPFEIVRMEREALESGLREQLLKDAQKTSSISKEDENFIAEETLELSSAGIDAPIIKLVNTIFIQAIQNRGTDIHIEPYEKDAWVRIRTDGDLHEAMRMPKQSYNGVCARIKVMAKLNLAENRLPQDGRMRVKSGTKVIDVRVSLLPTQFGERIVMRILDRTAKMITLEQLGMEKRDFVSLDSLIHKPYGSILITGPTGSGKSTTLYAIIERIKSEKTNIITVEDPVEYQIEGIGQMPVNSKIGLTFADGLRSILRQDPDIIMVGEIRDSETAEIVTHASLTGHLVFSTLHTNDAPSAVARLVDMGVEPYLISSSLLGVMAQRLVRKLCPDCKVKYSPSKDELRGIGIDSIPPNASFYKNVGCQSCMNTGFWGRCAIFELMTLDEEIQSEIIRNADSNKIRNLARKKGMRTLLEDGRNKAMLGLTTIAEATRATKI